MSKICYFFATKDDLLAVTERVESEMPIKYVRFGNTIKLPPETFSSAAQIQNLGIASHRATVGCDKFLVCDSTTKIRAERLKTITEEIVERSDTGNKEFLRALVGLERFSIDQLYNPDTITFNPGGFWKEDILLHGGVDTASNSEASLKLMRHFKAAIKSKFSKVKMFYVGPQALALLKQGKRLTAGEQSPPEYDLKLE